MGYQSDSAPRQAPPQTDHSSLLEFESIDRSDFLDDNDPRVYHPSADELDADERIHQQELSELRAARPILDVLESPFARSNSLERMKQVLHQHCPQSYREGKEPAPTNAEPGSAEKLQILQDRIARGESTSNRKDAYKLPDRPWYCPGTPRPVMERLDPEIRRLHQDIEAAIRRQDFDQIKRLQAAIALYQSMKEVV